MEKFYCGQIHEYTRSIKEEDVLKFAYLTEDCNPIHIDKEAAEKSIFKKPIAHGMFVASAISGVLGMKMPGPGTIYMNQNIKFLKPVYIGDVITVKIEIIDIDEKQRAKLATDIYNQEGIKVIEGEALVKLPEERG